jgi:outer membrane protein assembly factor BamB
MSNPFDPASTTDPNRWPVRWWPGLLLLVAVLAMLFVPPFFIERTSALFMLMMFAPVVAVVGGITWWLGLSRVEWADRLAVLGFFVVPLGLYSGELVAAGQAPMAPLVYGVPFVLAAWVGWLIVSTPLGKTVRRVGTCVAVLLAWLAYGTVRVEQTDADLMPQLVWRWTPKPEDAFAAVKGERQTVSATANVIEVKPGDWAEFRGPNRDNALTGVNLDQEKFATAKELWKVRIGPGWGSFAVVGNRLFTQEQQGDNEAVVCLDADSGKLVWEHVYPAKFTEAIAGAGPRSTPMVAGGRVYSMGATGQLKCLDAASGKDVWTTDIVQAAEAKLPMWGFASSPLVIHGKVIVYTGGAGGKGTTAFDADSGKVAWAAGKAVHGYSSAHRVVFAGVEQVLMASDYGLESFDPKTGVVLWEHAWPLSQGNRTCQPIVFGDGDVILGTGVGLLASRRLKVTKTADGWDVKTVWETRKLSPYFNDGVVHKGHYYGFSGKTFHCIDLADGKEKWSVGAKYGNGQVLLLADQDLLVVSEAKNSLTDVGRVFLLDANPDDHTELSSFASIKGKTWNHPSIANGRLYIRNGVEAACYEWPRR